MAINKIYFSHKTYNWKNHGTRLLDSSNLKQVLADDTSNDYHTSVADLRAENIQTVVKLSKEIILIELDFFSHPGAIDDNEYYAYGRLVNELLTEKHKVKNFEWIDQVGIDFFNSVKKQRNTQEPVLWTAGCSITHGTGVLHKDRWGSIVSSSLELPELCLAYPGSSINWSADQILRSDIRPGDILVWGLTSVPRIEYAKDWNLHATTVVDYTKLPKHLQHYSLNYFDSQTKFVTAIRSILQVINFCKKLGVEFYLINLLDTTYFKLIFSNMTNYCDCAEERFTPYKYNHLLNFIDLGFDKLHPGPRQHQHYAEQILKLIKENNHGN